MPFFVFFWNYSKSWLNYVANCIQREVNSFKMHVKDDSSIQSGIFIFSHFLVLFIHLDLSKSLFFFNYFSMYFHWQKIREKYNFNSWDIPILHRQFPKNDLICQKKSFQNKKKTPNKRKMCNVYQCKSSVSCDKIASPMYPKSVYTMKFKNSLGEH